MKNTLLILLNVIMILSLIACKGGKTNPQAEQPINEFNITGSLTIIKSPKDSLKFDIEIADTPEETELGLMNRKVMNENQAMLFIFPYEKVLTFWMKNTYIPLDIIYFDTNNKIVHIAKNAIPFNEELIPSEMPALYALEIKAGLSDKLGIKTGMKMKYITNKQ